MILGIDVSGWNTSINWQTLYDGGIRFAIVKLTQGINSLTRLAREHVEGARKAGILVAGYHWNDPMYNDTAQVDFFVSQLEKYDIHLAFVDVEQYWQDWNEWYKQSITKIIDPKRISQSAYNVMTGLRNKGYNAQIYSRWSFIKERSSQMETWIKPLDTWYAHYPYGGGRVNANWQDFKVGGRYFPGIKQPTLPVGTNWKLWQFSGDKFILPGTGGSPIDLNYFPGTEKELIKFFTGIENNNDTELPEPEPPTNSVLLPKLKVISKVRVRTLPNTSLLAKEIRFRYPGELVHVEEIKVNGYKSVWVRDKDGWSAVVHADFIYME